MVLGIRSKSRKSVSIQVHFVIHVQEINPWPPSQSLRSAQPVLLHWENGDKNSGSFASIDVGGKLEFNESFRLSALLHREASKKGKHRDGFHKNFLEFRLYDSHNGKISKSHLLGSATINLADYGIIKETTPISTLVNCKKSSRNSAQPFLYLNVQPFDIESSSSSPKSSLSKELSIDKEESDSVSRSVISDNDEDLEIASFTDDEDDDVSTISSQTVQSASEITGDSTRMSTRETASTSSLAEPESEPIKQLNGIKSPMSSTVVSSDMRQNAVNDSLSLQKSLEESVKDADSNYKIPESIHTTDAKDKIVSSASCIPVDMQSQMIQEGSRRGQRSNKDGPEKVSSFCNAGILQGKEEKEQKGKGEEEKLSMSNKLVDEVIHNISEDDSIRKGKLKIVSLPESRESRKQPTNILNMNDTTEDGKSHKLPLDTAGNNGLFSKNQVMDAQSQIESSYQPQMIQEGGRRGQRFSKDGPEKISSFCNAGIMEAEEEKEQKGKGEEENISMNNKLEGKVVHNLSEDDSIRKGKLNGDTLPVSRESNKQPTNILNVNTTEDGKSQKLSLDTAGNNGIFSRNQAMDTQSKIENSFQPQMIQEGGRKGQRFGKDGPEKISSFCNAGIMEAEEEKEQKGKGEEENISTNNKLEEKVVHNLSEDDSIRKGKLNRDTLPVSRESNKQPTNILNVNTTEDGKSHKLSLDTAGNNGLFSRNQAMDTQSKIENSFQPQMIQEGSRRGQTFSKDGPEKVSSFGNAGIMEAEEEKEQKGKGEKENISMSNKLEGKVVHNLSEDDSIRKGKLNSDTLPVSRESNKQPTSILNVDTTEDGKSHKLSLDTDGNNGLFCRNQGMDAQSKIENSFQPQMIQEGSRRGQRFSKDGPEKVSTFCNAGIKDGKEEKKQKGKGEEEKISMSNKLEGKVVHNLSEDDSIRKGKLNSDTLPVSRESNKQPTSILNVDDRAEDGKSHKLPLDTAGNNVLFSRDHATDQREENTASKDSLKSAICDAGPAISDNFLNNTTEMNSEVEMLREELREAAALEVSLYSVVAEHGGSANKVHTPARRLSRFYIHSYRVGSPARRASAAQIAVSGFVLVSKACGNDVPRLTFWLSNLISFRAILRERVEKIQHAEVPCILSECDGSGSIKGSSLKRSQPHNKEEKENTVNYSSNWEDPNFFLIALEKVEAWIFSRIVESVWWQTLTPHMQSAAAKSSGSKKIYRGKCSFGDQEQGNFSIDLWKRAFKDACERLCPLRAGGHECGCLPVIARLVMEQLINRLDVAMFNAILRESDEEMPMDPISDPISDSKVLPIPAGKSGFGAGAQLKNAIGNWSRWLSDLFVIDDSDSAEDRNESGDNKSPECQTSFKPFHLLNALSDLMMLPFEMLADGSTRKEVCPRFDVALIKRVLYNFVPDDFCPGPIPDAVFDALDAEDLEDNGGSVTSFTCVVASTMYSPPPAASVMKILQEVGGQVLLRSGSSVLKKSYTSDDELDDLDSPLSTIGIDDISLGRSVVRYELLRQVWRDSE